MTQHTQYIPAGYRTITPYLMVPGAIELIEFVKQAFGAVENYRGIGSEGGLHAEIRIGDSMLMIGGGAGMRDPMPAALYLYMEDVDAVYQRALQAGATSLSAPEDQPYGDRNAGVKDPFGNIWYIATHIKDVPLG
ncbi:MAG TPA: VOC family protein [Ktedonosporobacter sp.]|nr:VOC family protein [Ktedonosporobacter sp.]